ncbi:hypothetical protein ACFWIA_12670 [Streptomyces sp. NPDC127068]|uniref:hypothetical protein n=1 Tax=Streptomyces sp. NPDC127068 TaxID=3347127 RepID=UPI0036596395
MTQPHPDVRRLVALIAEHDRSRGSIPDPDGKIAGYDGLVLLGAAGHRARFVLEGHGTLRNTLTPRQLGELCRLFAVAWQDGFAVGARSRQP